MPNSYVRIVAVRLLQAARVVAAPRRRSAVVTSVIVGITIVGLGWVGNRLAWSEPRVISPTGPSLGVTNVSRAQPVRIVFDHPVKESALRTAIHPKLSGTWTLDTAWLAGTSTLTFTPSESPDLATRYTIELSGIRNLAGGQPKKYLLSFQTDTVPTFVSISPANEAVEVMPDAPIVLSFDKALSDAVDISLSATPEIQFDAPVVAGRTVTFAHASLFQKGAAYELKAFLRTVKRNYETGQTTLNDELVQLTTSAFTTIAAPAVQHYAPTGTGVDPNGPIRLEFKQVMERESTQAAFSITPSVAGSFAWETDQIMVFTPGQPLTKGQTYDVALANTAKAASGFALDENFTWSFTTIGLVTVTGFSPADGATGADVTTPIRIVFNQPVDHASAEKSFSISPATAGAFAWDGNTMIFDPASNLAYNVTYTVTVAAGVKTIHGLDSTSPFSARFGTRNQTVMLSVPAYRQAHVYSCMIAAARSALAFRGKNLSESAIIAAVGIDSTKWSGTWGGSNGVWGDPDAAIVGPLDNAAATSPAGKSTTNVYWGYGSHWGPIARAMNSFGVDTEVKSGMTVSDLARSIADGRPVIVWWVNGIWPSYEVRWKTPSGKSVRGVNGMHVQVVRGFTGPVENPVSFTVTDSGYGYPGRTYDVGTFKAKWGWFGNTGIVVK